MKKAKKIAEIIFTALAYTVVFFIGAYFHGMLIWKMTKPFTPLFDEFCKEHNNDLLYYTYSPLKYEYGEINIDDKRADLEYFFDVLESSCGAMPYYEKEYNFSLEEMKNKYLKIIESTSSDYEYAGTLITMVNSMPSNHISVPDPDYDKYFVQYQNEYEHADLYVNMNEDCIRMCNSWDKLLTEEGKKHSADKCLGILRGSSGDNSFEYKVREYDQVYSSEIKNIISYNGMSYDEYTANELTIQAAEFDKNEKKLIKRTQNLYYEPSETSHKVTVKAELNDGTICELELYNDYCRDVAAAHYFNSQKYLSEAKNKESAFNVQPVYYYDDAENNVAYINITEFNFAYTDMWNEAIANISSENLVLDLRNCIGGYVEYIPDVIYPSLSNKDMQLKIGCYTPVTEYNYKQDFHTTKFRVLKAKLFSEKLDEPFMKSDKKYFYQTELINLKGGETTFKKIYVLTGSGTFSAADRLTYIMKNLDNATVIGTDTAGDGTASGSNCSSLTFRFNVFTQIMPESKLLFTYTPQISLNENNKLNEIYGTPPDIYVKNDEESERILNVIIQENENPYTYDNRRKWDKVLNAAVALMESND